jgi:hypothetical protein
MMVKLMQDNSIDFNKNDLIYLIYSSDAFKITWSLSNILLSPYRRIDVECLNVL